ncbi:uncharacterized protein LOC132706781 [Cylas formicarius]|uniref:uncharacterized protein LOC132706781 n=1 Tax=Cylas formicarius TaxID=197179 RepID=UPI0029585E0E|nr:uncharacterized protein LOC132706781 [Cylas formicarius]
MRLFLLVCLCLVDIAFERSAAACPAVSLKNGRIRSRQRGRFLKFICNAGYLLAGEKYSICTHGRWDLPPPKCVRPTCQNKAKAPENGLIFPSHGGGVLNFYCKAGYELRGTSVAYCDGLKWDNVPPTCFPTDRKPKLFCDFEDNDICSWTHDLNHHFDWKRESYQTPSGSIGTGPSFDHTKGAKGKNGHYMYIESSSRWENDTARLISPVFDKMATNNTCLEFWYHMFGKTTGTLRAYVKKVKDPWPLSPQSAIFSKSGNQGDMWYRSFHNLGTIDDDFQVVMEGVRGPGYVSDIAIDDVRIIENCDPDDYVYTTTEEPVTENETPKTVESCANRCGLVASGNDGNTMIACDCNDNCFDRNRCCPDYFDVCLAVASSTSDVYPTTTDGSAARETSAQTETTDATTQYKPPTIRKRPAVAVPNVTRRPIVLLTPPPVPEYVEKVNPKWPPLRFPHTAKPVQNVETNDVIDLPPPSTNDDDDNGNVAVVATATTPLADDEDNSAFDRDEYVEELAKEFEVPRVRALDPIHNKEFAQRQDEPSDVKTILAVVTSCCGVAVLIIVAVSVLARRKCVKCYRKRIAASSGNGDSQSDVRFLTADEVLDFSLERDYDDL